MKYSTRIVSFLSAALLGATATYAAEPAVPTDAREVRPLLPGTELPEATVNTMEGEARSIRELSGGKPSVFIFYRGGWCPYCNAHLSTLGEIEADLTGMGYQVFAISPDQPQKLPETVAKTEISYVLLSDASMEAAKAFGIAFRVDEPTVDRYRGFGIDLEEASGQAHHMLPVPAVFLAGQDGVIAFSHANPDYKVRLDNEVLLAAAKAALK